MLNNKGYNRVYTEVTASNVSRDYNRLNSRKHKTINTNSFISYVAIK